MRTSRIARDTAKILPSLASRRTGAASAAARQRLPSQSTKSRHFASTPDPDPSSDSDVASPASSFAPDEASDGDFKTAAPSKKRKRGQDDVATSTRAAAVVKTATTGRKATVKMETEAEIAVVDEGKPRKARRAPAKRVVAAGGSVKYEAPTGWETLYEATKEFRQGFVAPVDTMGCERLADPKMSEKDQRFQTLVSLMLSSQTKDAVTAAAIKNLQTKLPGSLTVESILALSPADLNSHIEKVGFHNNKTKYIKQVAEILRDRHDSDIPDTIEGLVALPGVGPKMAYLCMSAAWGRDEGIGVDVHVHRITNLWGWHKTKTPEETRQILESWLPRDKWHEINTVLVGLGQTICMPAKRKCGECGLADQGLCPAASVGKKVSVKKEKTVITQEEKDASVSIMAEEELSIIQQDINVEDIKSPSIADIEDLVSGPQSHRRTRRSK